MARPSSVEQVRRYLLTVSAGKRPEDADGSLAVHVAELHQRVRRLAGAGASMKVNLSPAVRALHLAAETCQEVRG